jgi:PRA1 family protein
MSAATDSPSDNLRPPPVDIESLRLQLSTLVARVHRSISLETLRPLPVFLGLSSSAIDEGMNLSPDAFSAPLAGADTMTLIRSRVHDNITFYMSNYALVAAMTAIVIVVMHPSLMVIIAALYGLWWCHGYLIRHEVNVCTIPLHSILTVQQRFYVLFAISFLVMMSPAFVMPTILMVFISGFIILCHAALRDTTHLHEASQRGRKLGSGGGDESSIVDPLLPAV